jgi:ABC-type Mn2+/Zn2+ transport system permease subunit
MLHALSDPWTHAFMQRAFLELTLLGIVGAVLGCWVLFYELSYGAESLAHALFPGLVVAALVGLPLLLGAAGGVLVAAVAVAVFGRTPEIGRDTAIAVVITSLFGLGVLLALAPASPPGLNGLLFGDLFAATNSDLLVAAFLAVAVLGGLTVLHRQLLAVGFDRSNARALGGKPLFVDLALLGALAAAIVIGVQGLGNLLVLAVIVGPAATARLLVRRMLPMMALAVALAVGCGAGGLYLSYYADTAGGASVAAVVVVVYLLGQLFDQASVESRRFANSRKRFLAASSGPTGASSA